MPLRLSLLYPSPIPYVTTSSSYENKVTIPPLSSHILRSQHVPKSNVSSASPSGLGSSILLDKNLVPTMMEVGAHENLLMLENT